jgi:hypothetical protein
MSKIKVTDTEFPNVVVAYLLDMLIHEDEPTGNELFDKLIQNLKQKGMFPILMRYFRNMDPRERQKYKFIKKGVSPHDSTDENAIISVIPNKDEAKEE